MKIGRFTLNDSRAIRLKCNSKCNFPLCQSLSATCPPATMLTLSYSLFLCCRCSFNTHKTSSRLEPQMFDWKPKLFHVWWVIRGHQIPLTPDGVFDGGRLAVCETHFSFCLWSHLNCLQQKKWIYNNMLFYLWINVFSFLTVLFLLLFFLTKISCWKKKILFTDFEICCGN